MPKRRVLLVDDEVAVLLTLKAVLEISGFDVDTAASAREAQHKLKTRVYEMVITDMRMESEQAGRDVIVAARTAEYHPAVALLTAFPVADEDWQDMGADKMLVKPMQTRSLIQSIEKLLESHQAKLKKLEKGGVTASLAAGFAAGVAAGKLNTPTPAKTPAKKTAAKQASKKVAAKKAVKPAKKIPAQKAPHQEDPPHVVGLSHLIFPLPEALLRFQPIFYMAGHPETPANRHVKPKGHLTHSFKKR